MIRFRHTPWIVPTLALTLMLGACSTPADLTAPTLEPQFGTADNDFGVDVATGSSIFITGATQGSLAHSNMGNNDGYVRKLSSSGNAVWTR